MTRGLAKFAVFAVLALSFSGQAFAVSSTRDNDAALRAMMDDRPHRPDPKPAPAAEPREKAAPRAQPQEAPEENAPEPSSSAESEASQAAPASENGASQEPASDAPAADGEAQPADAVAADKIEGEAATHGDAPKEGEAAASDASAKAPAHEGAEKAAEGQGGGWLSNMLPSVFGGGGKSEPKADAKPTGEHTKGEGEDGAAVASPEGEHAALGSEGAPEQASDEAAKPHEGKTASEGEAAAPHDAAQEEAKPEGGEHGATDGAAHEGEANSNGEHAAQEAPKAEESSSWLSYIPFLGGSSKKEEPKAEAAAHGDAPAAEAGGDHAAQEAKPAEDHGEAAAEGAADGHANGEAAAPTEAGEHASAEGAPAHEGEPAKDAHAAKDAPKADESSSWLSYIPFLGGSSKKEEPKAEAAAHGEGASGEAPKEEHAAQEGGEHAAAEGAPAHEGDAKPADAHGEKPKDDKAHEAKAEGGGGGWMSYIPFIGGGKTEAKPEKAKDGHGKKKGEHGEEAKDGHGEAPAEGHGEAPAEGHGEAAAEGGHGETAEDGTVVPPPMWPEEPAVEDAKQPFVRVRQLRRLQDSVAKGSIAAYDQQKTLMRELADEMRALPPEVWDDTRNVRAAVYFVLTGGDPRVLMAMLERETPIYVPRRLIRAALAYGEGRTVDARQSFENIEPEMLAPELQGMVSLIKGTLLSKNEPKKAIKYFDKARLYAPGALVEESALRQQILLVANAGDMTRFDFLSSAYARRFPRSLFARNFRRQLFAGIAKQVFKGENEWISRTETEMQRLPPGERAGLYLSIAEEATKGGHIKIAQFAASNAAKLYTQGSRELDRARLYEGAVLVATEDREKGVELLKKVRPQILKPADRELYDAAQLVATAGLPRAAEPRQFQDEKPPPSVVKAEDLLKSTEALLAEETQ